MTTLSHQFSLSQRQVADVVSYTRDQEASIGDIEKAADVQVARYVLLPISMSIL